MPLHFRRLLDAARDTTKSKHECSQCHNEPAVGTRRMASGEQVKVGRKCRNAMGTIPQPPKRVTKTSKTKKKQFTSDKPAPVKYPSNRVDLPE